MDKVRQNSTRVLIVPVKIDGLNGYDVKVQDTQATVEDYLCSFEQSLAKISFSLTRNPGGKCFGCGGCCDERIPLTWIDFLRLSEKKSVARMREELPKIAALKVRGRVVDITLKRNAGKRCIFFDTQRRLCLVYPQRPLVCRTFICCPSTWRAQELRGAITNTGEDELVRRWVLQGPAPQCVSPGDWAKNAFTGCYDYKQIKLADICPPNLWMKLQS